MGRATRWRSAAPHNEDARARRCVRIRSIFESMVALERRKRNAMTRTVVSIGLRETGKTTYLAAFWDVIGSGDVQGSLELVETTGDMQYLNEIRICWANCQPITRTGPASNKPVSMLVRHALTGQSTELAWTDMLGEQFERQWTERAWTRGYQELVERAVGALLFVHPRSVKNPPLIVDAERATRRMSSPNLPAADASREPDQNAIAEPEPKPEPKPTP